MNRLSQQSIDQQASNFLSDLIYQNVIDTEFSPLDERRHYLKYFSWFRSVREKKHVHGNHTQYHLWTAAQSQRWQESHLSPQTQPDMANYWAIELAQFAVPQGHVGFVRKIEQVVNDVNGSYYPTNVSFWGSPTFVDPDVDNLRWYLTISPYYGAYPARVNFSSAGAIPVHWLPGAPYADLYEIDALWYPAHNSKHLKLIVPGKHVLRFFLLTPPTVTYQWQVSGKLSGNTQSTYQICAVQNARGID